MVSRWIVFAAATACSLTCAGVERCSDAAVSRRSFSDARKNVQQTASCFFLGYLRLGRPLIVPRGARQG